ncbi:Protein priA [Grifola frondosa]|uniref:Protein priA n=1 Tax=Grifola frondosa TaxID=5627 RepID=A0A1C7LV74_GRIFR|nr:Protein priA [Grifola frondosa]
MQLDKKEHFSRGTSDVCADVDAELVIPGLLGTPPFPIGILDLCLCLSGIPALMATNPLVITATALDGQTAIKAVLTDMVNSAKDHETCSYPDNADASCIKGNPCGFSCTNGFTPQPASKPTDCVCNAPNKVCNGVCGNFKSCPSGKLKRREVDLHKRATCAKGLTACGVYGWTSARSTEVWECIDTTSDLESCGGCAIPLGSAPAQGIDCTAIPGVADVSCNAGSCLVNRCLPGYLLSSDGTFCLRAHAMMQAEGDLPAAAYGLEHVPLKA